MKENYRRWSELVRKCASKHLRIVIVLTVTGLLLLPTLIAKPVVQAQSSQCITCALNCYVVSETVEFQCLQNGGDELECRRLACCAQLHCLLTMGCGGCSDFVNLAVECCGQ